MYKTAAIGLVHRPTEPFTCELLAKEISLSCHYKWD